jgi:hypothetical protein
LLVNTVVLTCPPPQKPPAYVRKKFAAIPVNCGSTQPVPRPETLNPY